jgi:hypothetical protein
MTRPAQACIAAWRCVLMQQGKVKAPDEASGRYLFEDFYVATLSTHEFGRGTLLQCWGVVHALPVHGAGVRRRAEPGSAGQ